MAENLTLASSTTPAILTVGQLNQQVKLLLEGQIGQIWVKGEVSNFKAHTSGHFYFSLKDAGAQITAVMFRGFNSRLAFKPQDGLEVLVRARISVYEPRGQYQIICETMEPVGAGALQKAFENLKLKLKAEGLFDLNRKKSLPLYPQHIAVVTSPTGAALQDILNIISRRAPFLHVTVVPTMVQGEGAAEKIKQALILAQNLPAVDVIILGRGGGSIEDLWAFNDENLAREISICKIPIISAVGHEIDFTISDFVADLRAPTPSAAAELVAKSSNEVLEKIQHVTKMLHLQIQRKVKINHDKIMVLRKSLIDPKLQLQDLMLRNDDLYNRIDRALKNQFYQLQLKLSRLQKKIIDPKMILENKKIQLKNLNHLLKKQVLFSIEQRKNQLAHQAAVMDSLSPLRVVSRGYSIVKKQNQVVKSYKELKPQDRLQVQLAEGSVHVAVLEPRSEDLYGV